MAHDPHHNPTDSAPDHVDDVASVVTVYVVVLALAVANIFLAGTGLGAMALPVQLGIASVQACLVAWYWMHMRRGDTAVTLSAFTTLFFMFIFFVLVLADVLTRWRAAI
jgi:cytochrome c oxidase subunit 4